MEIVKYNSVFDHVEVTLREISDKNPKYDGVVVVLGYNCWKNLDFVRDRYPRHRLVIFQLEQLFEKSKWWNENTYKMLKSADGIWDYDKNNVLFLRSKGIKANYFPMRYTENLRKLPDVNGISQDIDVLIYGYMNERRNAAVTDIQNKLGKLKTISLFNVWGDELDSYLERAKIILNVHYYPISIQEQVRIYYPVINGRCVLSEVSLNNVFGNSIIETKYENLTFSVSHLIKTGQWMNLALQCSYNFKKICENSKF